ncbi:MAG TPA: MBL fold metallo-hydrolase [Pyrinomonadaceae bacterium]|jgi:hypothetical protein
MEIRLVSHASVIIKSDVTIWTDPWLNGKAFNDSWSLSPQPAFDESLYGEIDYIFISHEHPDHFHVPTLRAMPQEFKSRVTILYQRNNSEKMFDAFKRLGFPKAIALPHREIIGLTEKTKVYCYQAGTMDSALAVENGGEVVLNLNDCEINAGDCSRILSDLGKVDVVLNQFSIAGYSGFHDYENHLPKQSRNILEKMLANHLDLQADVTIPFASFIYFSSEDNRYINEYSNKPQNVADFFAEKKQKLAVLYPGETYRTGREHDSTEALVRFRKFYDSMEALNYDKSEIVEFEEIEAAFNKLVGHLHEKYPVSLLRLLLKPVSVRIPDLDRTIVFSVATGELREDKQADPDLIIKSQPLHFGFSYPYGIQTLGVSARYTLIKNFPNWRNHRIIFSLNNAELYLRPKFLLSPSNLKFFRERLPGAWNQFLYRLKVMR